MEKVLILSGGGAKGAFSVGALTVLEELRGQLDFTLISGTSTGSLIAGLLAANRLDILKKIYLNVDNTNIVTPQNIITNIRNNIPYLISDAPLRTIIDREITQVVADSILHSEITLLLTAVSLQTGKITVFSNHEITATPQSKYNYRHLTTRGDLLFALSASSNQFAFMPPMPMNVGGGGLEQMIDGGVRDTIPTKAVFEIDPDPDEIVILSNNPLELFPVATNYTSPIDILMRGISIFIQDVRDNDLAVLDEWKARTNKDYILIQPDADLDQAYPTGLRFEPQRMAAMMVKGERKAREVLGAQPRVFIASGPGSGSRTVAAKKRSKPLGDLKSKTKDFRCRGITNDGKRCKNQVHGRALYCHLHSRA